MVKLQSMINIKHNKKMNNPNLGRTLLESARSGNPRSDKMDLQWKETKRINKTKMDGQS